ncbi:hypothetical protein MTP10_03690 [Nonomuraea sp. 3-1Str]|uniref:hypothetical protein n=1 Tax=Nonomuraea sp. 3-1Str TaxID=2929801 RepID=UPI002861BF44|nr:hypothetical protein [Nonomuraea sp. 3-1Str]MDR8407837.1 hypothetical protein [Nonomuraea sp. 3-1Str]
MSDVAAQYRLTANSFIADGGYFVLTEGIDRVDKVRDIDAFESSTGPIARCRSRGWAASPA